MHNVISLLPSVPKNPACLHKRASGDQSRTGEYAVLSEKHETSSQWVMSCPAVRVGKAILVGPISGGFDEGAAGDVVSEVDWPLASHPIKEVELC